jgi:hypothetical protein
MMIGSPWPTEPLVPPIPSGSDGVSVPVAFQLVPTMPAVSGAPVTFAIWRLTRVQFPSRNPPPGKAPLISLDAGPPSAPYGAPRIVPWTRESESVQLAVGQAPVTLFCEPDLPVDGRVWIWLEPAAGPLSIVGKQMLATIGGFTVETWTGAHQ